MNIFDDHCESDGGDDEESKANEGGTYSQQDYPGSIC